MIKRTLFCAALFCLALSLSGCDNITKESTDDLARYVNPFIGASTSVGAAGVYHGLGKTFPGATMPYGMVQVSPNTITGGDNGSGYSYEHKTIEGFALTQMSGVGWFGELGNFLVMPTTGELQVIAGKEDGTVKGYRSSYDKNTESASAGYYTVSLDDYGIKVETTAAMHSGMMRFTFPENERSRIQIDLARRVGGTSTSQYVKVVNDNTIKGWIRCTPDGGGWGNGDGNVSYTLYFFARFSKPLSDYGFWSADIPNDWPRKRDDVTSQTYLERVAGSPVIRGVDSLEGKHIGFFTEFATAKNETVTLQAAISFVDMEGAQRNFEAEMAGREFDTVRHDAREAWNEALKAIEVWGGSNEQRTIFYTSLYHTMIDPRICSDIDGRYVGGDGKIYTADGFHKRTIFSGWDVFRSQFPLQTIINPELVNDQINSLVTLAEQSGRDYFPRWELLNSYSGCMIGNPALSVLADAYVKGIRGYDIDKAYRFAVNSSAHTGNGDKGFTGGGLSISHTLEYAYADWCVAQLASALGRSSDARNFTAKGRAYRNVFDAEKGWFRPRNEDGSWQEWPEDARLKEWYGCVECNPYQQGWFVPHDVKGMVELMGGRDKTVADLEAFFDATPENMLWNQYYNHANEPVHHVLFLFNRLGVPSLTQKWSRYVCDKAYGASVEGLVGNEDVGQMSAWYVLAASGIYPLCPGDQSYEITSPIFDVIQFNLPGTDRKFTIHARNNSPKNVYIQSVMLNGQKYTRSQLMHANITAGGTLDITLGSKPNDSWLNK